MDLFGPNTRLDVAGNYNIKTGKLDEDRTEYERETAKAVIKENQLVVPLFRDDGSVGLETILEPEVEDSIFNQKGILSDLKNGIIIPYDFVEVPKEDFVAPFGGSFEQKKRYEQAYTKFLARPDFFYVKLKGNNAHLIPVDVKSSDQITDARQISQFNSAMLYFHSNYMKNIVKYFKEVRNLNVVLENGFYLIRNSQRDSGDLEDYIKNNLRDHISIKLRKGEHAGIGFKEGIVNLTINKDEFASDMDYDFSTISESEMIAHFSFIKNRITPFTLYPVSKKSFNGFNGGNKPIFRLNYIAGHKIRTYNPKIDEYQNQITWIHAMQNEELMKKAHIIGKIADDRRLTTLKAELESKKKELNKMLKKREEKSHKFHSESRTALRNNRRFSRRVANMNREINKIENSIEKIKKIIKKERDDDYRKDVKRGMKEWNEQANKKRISLVAKLERYRKELAKKRNKWKIEDEELNEFMYQFQLNCLMEGMFDIAEKPMFHSPAELYMQFGTRKVMRVLMYNSFELEVE